MFYAATRIILGLPVDQGFDDPISQLQVVSVWTWFTETDTEAYWNPNGVETGLDEDIDVCLRKPS